MSLKVELKPGERFIVGGTVITNADQRTRLVIDGDAPILREKDIMTAAAATTPARRIYLSVQLMYLDGDIAGGQETYFALVRDFVAAAPSTLSAIDAMNNEILTGGTYKALKLARKLIEYEDRVLASAQSGSGGVSPDDDQDGGTARS